MCFLLIHRMGQGQVFPAILSLPTSGTPLACKLRGMHMCILSHDKNEKFKTTFKKFWFAF